MYSSNQYQGFPITITYLTKNRTLYQENCNSKSTFSTILENFEKNILYKNEAKLKSKYYLNGREISKTQLLEDLIKQSSPQPINNIDKAELSIELEDLCYNGDASYKNYKKIIQPKSNPFSLYVYSPKDKNINVQIIPEKTISLFELNKFNDGSAYCNGYNELYISGGNDNNKDFYIINNSNYEIKKKNMLSNKKNHSMLYLNFKENIEWVFIAGGEDKKSFYYDIKKNYFVNWGDTIETHKKPALIQLGEYLYILDEINLRKNFFERTKIISSNRKWEKIVPNFDKKLMANFPSKFGVSFDLNGKIILLGGDNIKTVNNTYVYEPGSNTIILSENGTNDSMLFNDKTFYKVNKRYSINLPQKLNEIKEICVADKEDQSLMKISLNSISNNKFNVISNLSFDDKILYNNNDKGKLTVKASYSEKKQNMFNQFNQHNKYSQNYNQNQESINQLICDDCLYKNTFICQCCHNSFQRNNQMNYTNNNYSGINPQDNFNPTKENPRVTLIPDEYFPTLSNVYVQNMNKLKGKYYPKVYNKNYNRARDKAKVEIIYDEYTPIKVDYELQKPGVKIKKYLYVKKEKEEIRKNEEEKPIKKEENIIQQNEQNNIQNEKPEQKLQNFENPEHNEENVQNEQKEENVPNEKNIENEENIQNEENNQNKDNLQNGENLQNEENKQNEENEIKQENVQKEENKENIQKEENEQKKENEQKEENVQKDENGLNEQKKENIQNEQNVENDEVEYRNYENNEQENKDDELFINDEHNQQNEVIIEENHNNYESNYNDEINGNIGEEEGEGIEHQDEIGIKAEENPEQIEEKGEFISIEEENNENIEHIENGEENNEQTEIKHIEHIEDDDQGENNEELNVDQNMKEEDNNIISQNKDKEIINGELPKDSLEFNEGAKIHQEENDLKSQHELDNENQEINNKNENENQEQENEHEQIQEDQNKEINIENNNEINIEENKNEENIIRDGESFHSMEEDVGEEQNNSVQHIENGNNEEMYENGNEIKFDGGDENINENENEENVVYNGEENEENKIIEYEGEGEEGGEMNVEEVEVHEENNENNEEGEMEVNVNGEEEGDEMNYEQGMEEGEEMNNEEGEEMNNEEGEKMNNEEGEEMNNEEGEEMNYEEGEVNSDEGEEMNFEGGEMNYEEGEGEGEEGNVSVIENNVENEEQENNGENNQEE